MDEGLRANLTSRRTWMRAVYMVLFVVAFYLARFLLGAIALIQFLFVLFGGRRLETLAEFGAQLAAWMGEAVAFLTFASEAKPFPFATWPDARPDEPATDEPTFL